MSVIETIVVMVLTLFVFVMTLAMIPVVCKDLAEWWKARKDD